MRPILTIAIPTYNRARYLRPLLDILQTEISAISNGPEQVEVYVSDNDSTDNTREILDRFREFPFFSIRQQSENIGPSRNVESCFANAQGRFVWILGDDDRPRQGLVRALVAMLEKHSPALVFLRGAASNELPPFAVAEDLTFSKPSRHQFLSQTGINLTFISSVVVDKDRARLGNLHGPSDVPSLPHLRWLFPLLKQGQDLVISSGIVLDATAGNTGGYNAIETFGVGFPNAVKQFFDFESDPDSVLLLHELHARFLPWLVWEIRFGMFRAVFEVDKSLRDCMEANRSSRRFLALTWPIANAPRPIALTFFTLSKAWFAADSKWRARFAYGNVLQLS